MQAKQADSMAFSVILHPFDSSTQVSYSVFSAQNPNHKYSHGLKE